VDDEEDLRWDSRNHREFDDVDLSGSGMSGDEFQTTESVPMRAMKKEFYLAVEESTKQRKRRHRASKLEASRRTREH
jgi:hypothetical protein